MKNRKNYEERLGGALDDKLRLVEYISESAEHVLDVGCYTGHLTDAMSKLRPDTFFYGIDVDGRAIVDAENLYENPMVEFIHAYLRELLVYPRRYDAIVFSSVLHEIFSYGEGMSSVVKALADAHELLKPGGRILIRDMPGTYSRATKELSDAIKLASLQDHERLMDFEEVYGKITETKSGVAHFLLKCLYYDNWKAEMRENYTGVDYTQLNNFFRNILGMKEIHTQTYTLGYLHNLWNHRFGIKNVEDYGVKSHMMMVYEKS